MSLNVPGVVVSGGAAVTDATGIATFGALQINTPGTGYILTASAGGTVPASAQSSAVQRGAAGVECRPGGHAVVDASRSSTPTRTITLTVTNNGPGAGDGRRADRYAAGGRRRSSL